MCIYQREHQISVRDTLGISGHRRLYITCIIDVTIWCDHPNHAKAVCTRKNETLLREAHKLPVLLIAQKPVFLTGHLTYQLGRFNGISVFYDQKRAAFTFKDGGSILCSTHSYNLQRSFQSLFNRCQKISETIGLHIEEIATLVNTTPEIALRILHNSVDTVGINANTVTHMRLHHIEMVSIKAVQSIPCGHPNHPLPVLSHLLHALLRKPGELIVVSYLADGLCSAPEWKEQ